MGPFRHNHRNLFAGFPDNDAHYNIHKCACQQESLLEQSSIHLKNQRRTIKANINREQKQQTLAHIDLHAFCSVWIHAYLTAVQQSAHKYGLNKVDRRVFQYIRQQIIYITAAQPVKVCFCSHKRFPFLNRKLR